MQEQVERNEVITDLVETGFQSLVFANDRSLYDEMFGQNANAKERQSIEDQVEWIRPENPDEVAELLRTLPK